MPKGNYKSKTKKEKNFVSKVTKIAKKAVHNVAEKKQYASSDINNFTAAFTYGTSLISGSVGTRYLMNRPVSTITFADRQPGTQGVGGLQRIGNEISVLKASVTIVMRLAAVGSQDVRVIWFIEQDSEGVTPNPTEMLTDVSAGNGAYAPWKQSDSSGRFRVLHDKVYNLTTGAGAATGIAGTENPFKVIKLSKAFKRPIKVEYYADTGSNTSSGIKKGAMYLMFIAGLGVTGVTINKISSNLIYTDV